MAKSIREVLDKPSPKRTEEEMEQERAAFLDYLQKQYPEVASQFLQDELRRLPDSVYEELIRLRREMEKISRKGYDAAAEELENKIKKIIQDRTDLPRLMAGGRN